MNSLTIQMFTVVPNIRQPTTCEELGETQSYIDDMEYLLAGFQADKLLASRCLRYEIIDELFFHNYFDLIRVF